MTIISKEIMSRDQSNDKENNRGLEQDSGFGLSRWARLKKEQQAKNAVAQLDDVIISNTEDSAESNEDEVLASLSVDEYCAQLPDIKSLGADSDFSVFMDERVLPNLRKRALRALFSQPHFNIRDGLDDYDDDYSYFEPLGDIETSDMKYAMMQERIKQEESIAQGVNDGDFGEEDAKEGVREESEVIEGLERDNDDNSDEDSVGESDESQEEINDV